MTDMPTTPSAPNPGLKALNRLIGEWEITNDVSGAEPGLTGRVTYEWMDGGFFLLQHVDMKHGGRTIKGVEYIRWDDENKVLKSHYFGTSGDYLEYVYELDGDTLIIWGGYVGSPAVFRGTFSADGRSNTGAWEWPGGGYESTMNRV